jgi:hypothetical protein
MKKRVHEVHSERTERKSQQGEATAGVRGLAKDAECQPREKNLRLLNIFDSLEKSSGNLQGLKRRTRGASGALDGSNSEFGSRKSGVGGQKTEFSSSQAAVPFVPDAFYFLGAEQRKIESAICVAILENVAMFRKNQGMLRGKVAKGMWQSWKMRESQITRRRKSPVCNRTENCKLQIGGRENSVRFAVREEPNSHEFGYVAIARRWGNTA